MGATCCGCRTRKIEAIQRPLNDEQTITYKSIKTNTEYRVVPTTHAYQTTSNIYDRDIVNTVHERPDLCDEIELNLSLRNTPKQGSCPCDPFIVVSIKDEMKNVYNVIDKTEVVRDSPDADFSKEIRIRYMFEEVQYIRLDIYDFDDDDDDDDDDDEEEGDGFVGTVEFIMGDLVTAHGQKLVMAIGDKNGDRLSQTRQGLQPLVIVRALEIDNNIDEVELVFAASGLPKMDYFFKSIDPFFQIYRINDDDSWASVYKSEHKTQTYSPRWNKVSISTRRLCHGDMDKPILIKCWNWNRDALPNYACQVTTNLRELLNARYYDRSLPWRCFDAHKHKYTSKSCGRLHIREAHLMKKYSFSSFLKGGLEMHLMVAIDFTGSNGTPTDNDSLHYMGAPHYESQYLKVIKSVGRVLAPYDADECIHAFGFGANLTPFGEERKVSHCFNLTLQDDARVDGIDGLAEAYVNCLDKVQLFGPTHLNEIIASAKNKSINICSQDKQSYNILLIITDGVINDMQLTINQIVEGSRLPMSIIIVGVGDADFANMERLDADDDPLRHNRTGEIMQRCIVQFVPFNEFKNQHISAIARETLEEIPEQVSGYMSKNNIHPNASLSVAGNDEKTDIL
eukprot:352685_1